MKTKTFTISFDKDDKIVINFPNYGIKMTYLKTNTDQDDVIFVYNVANAFDKAFGENKSMFGIDLISVFNDLGYFPDGGHIISMSYDEISFKKAAGIPKFYIYVTRDEIEGGPNDKGFLFERSIIY